MPNEWYARRNLFGSHPMMACLPSWAGMVDPELVSVLVVVEAGGVYGVVIRKRPKKVT